MQFSDLNIFLGAGSFFVGALGSAFAFWRWVIGTLRASEAEANTRMVILQTQIDLTRAQLNEFKLDVAKNYASDDRLQRMEMEVKSSIEKLINRVDAFVADFSKLVGRMERAQHIGP